MKSLVLAEKPSVGREIARVLNCQSKGKSYCENKKYIVTWAMGHLVELADPSSYNEKFKKWEMETLPILPQRPKLKVIKRTSGQFRQIKTLLNKKEVTNVIIATDAGREGELVARWILRLASWKGPIQRLWISSQTDKAIKSGFASLKPGKDYINLSLSAESRAEADWLIGLNTSRALSCHYDTKLSAGRVQTPTLSLMVERELKRQNFTPKPFWIIEANYGSFQAFWFSSKGHNHISSQEKGEELVQKLKQSPHIIKELNTKDILDPPPLAYDLTELQREANKRLGFSAKKTLQVLQGLYERHKIVTYPRTDSKYITSDMKDTLGDRLKALKNTPWGGAAHNLIKNGISPGKRFINDKGVTDHHAIIPTEELVDLTKLNSDEKMLWDLIARRYIAVLSSPAKEEKITLILEVQSETLKASGQRVLSKGWKAIDQGIKEKIDYSSTFSSPLPQKGEFLEPRSITLKKRETSPAKRYNDASLLGAMENLGGGLGTPATRADIIEKLLKHYYIEREGKELVPTSRGFELLNLVPDLLKSPELTCQWEEKLSQIANGTLKKDAFIAEIKNSTKNLVSEIKQSKKEYKALDSTGEDCPFCGRKMIKTKGKKGQIIKACLALSCGFEEEQRKGQTMGSKPSRKEKAMGQKLIRQYSDNSKETMTLGDMIKLASSKK